MIGELRAVRVTVGEASPQPVLLVGEQHDAHRSSRAQVQCLHQPQRFPRDDAAAAIVDGAGAHVPGVEVTADQDDFVRTLAPDNLADHVGGIGVPVHRGVHPEAQSDALSPGRQALEAQSVLDGNCGRGNPWGVGSIGQHPGVRSPQAIDAHRAHEARGGPQPAPRATGPTFDR